MRVADYIAETLADHGIRHVFLVTGGGAMHLNDAIGRCARLAWVPFHHEQAYAMAADSYFRLTGRARKADERLSAVRVLPPSQDAATPLGPRRRPLERLCSVAEQSQVREVCSGQLRGQHPQSARRGPP